MYFTLVHTNMCGYAGFNWMRSIYIIIRNAPSDNSSSNSASFSLTSSGSEDKSIFTSPMVPSMLVFTCKQHKKHWYYTALSIATAILQNITEPIKQTSIHYSFDGCHNHIRHFRDTALVSLVCLLLIVTERGSCFRKENSILIEYGTVRWKRNQFKG